jgi:hypothetical protein
MYSIHHQISVRTSVLWRDILLISVFQNFDRFSILSGTIYKSKFEPSKLNLATRKSVHEMWCLKHESTTK